MDKLLDKLLNWVLNLYPVKLVINLSKRIVLPGFDGLSVHDWIQFFYEAIRRGRLNTRASSIAFSFFIALFPAIIFMFTLLPYLPIEGLQEQLLAQLQAFLPEEAYEESRITIEDLINRERSGLLSIGFLSTIYFASNGINRILSSFNQSVFAIDQRSAFVQRVVSLTLLLILTLLTIISVGLIVFKEILLGYLISKAVLANPGMVLLVEALNWIVIVALVYFSVSFIYFLGPAGISKWKFMSAGSSLATLLMILVSVGFAYFVNNFGQYNKLYGSIGTLIVIMLWINFNALVLLIGFELNASIINAGSGTSELDEGPENDRHTALDHD